MRWHHHSSSSNEWKCKFPTVFHPPSVRWKRGVDISHACNNTPPARNDDDDPVVVLLLRDFVMDGVCNVIITPSTHTHTGVNRKCVVLEATRGRREFTVFSFKCNKHFLFFYLLLLLLEYKHRTAASSYVAALFITIPLARTFIQSTGGSSRRSAFFFLQKIQLYRL